MPVYFLKAKLKEDFEPKPTAWAIDSMVRFLFGSLVNIRRASFTLYSLINALKFILNFSLITCEM